ncbi:hypothetical protein BA953_08780 [Vibrio coralliilyticus]|uniref:hypothetical protein n=1 Tax=Vibrio coralliilyticus TaxID=190893 RepID=UPI0008104661|nr:hypothetical protein [Vibrio coralliilyticus]ANW24305.1 hypothetical protein BA953_08780 [Vibrio coralliilyticus]
MSAIIAALGGNASASVGGTVGQAMDLRFGQPVVNLRSEDAESVATAAAIIDTLNTQISKLHELYREIESSTDPKSYFDDESVNELADADAIVRAFEEMLRIQYEGLVRKTGDTSNDAVVTAKKIRRTVAKLRSSVTAFISMNNQLKTANLSDYQPQLEMTSDKVAMLKAATESAASRIH